MKKFLLLAFLLMLVIAYLFFFAGIELDLKFVMEASGVKANRLIDASFRIRKFASIQLGIFIVVSLLCIILIVKKR